MLFRSNRHVYAPLRASHATQHRITLSSAIIPSMAVESNSETVEDTAHRVATLVNHLNWENNKPLKLLASHLTPYEASKVIELHRANIDLGSRFFKWVCKQSTYCYDLDSRIHLLNLLISSSLYEVAQKAILFMTKDCSSSDEGIDKLMTALDCMRKMGFRLSYPCYSTLLMSLAKLSMGHSVFLVYSRMKVDGFVPGFIDYKTVINALCKSGFVRAAEMFICRILRLGFDPDTHVCTSLVLGCCRVNDLDEAFRVFELMLRCEGCSPNSVTYSVLIHGLCEADQLGEAFRLQQEMVQKGCAPSTHTYTVLLKAMCDLGKIDEALNLFHEMIRKGSKPSIHTYTILIDRLCIECKLEEANAIFKKMVEDGLVAGTLTYNALINGYCKEGRVVNAFEFLSMMEKNNCKPNIRTYNELIEGLCKVQKSYKAMLLLRRVLGNGLLPNIITYNILVNGFCREGQLNMALSIYNSMNSIGVEADDFTFTVLIDMFCKKDRMEQAEGFLGRMMKKGISPDEVTYTVLIDGYCKISKTGIAFKLLEMMIEDKCAPGSHIFNSFLNAFTKENQLLQEQAIFGKVLKYGIVPSVVTYTILIDGLCRAGDVTQSFKVLELMRQTSCPPNVYTFTVLMHGLCQSERVGEAETLLNSMSDFGVAPNHVTYTILVKAHIKTGNIARAFEILDIMVKDGFRPNYRVYCALLKGLLSVNKNITVEELDTNQDKVEAENLMHNMDSGLLLPEENGGEWFSDNVFKEMEIDHAFTLRDKLEELSIPTSDLYNLLIIGLCKERRMAEADHLKQDMVKRRLIPDQSVCSFLIEHYCNECRFDHCLEFLNQVRDNGVMPSLSSYCAVIRSFHNEGKIQEAQRLVSDLFKHHGIESATEHSAWMEFLIERDEPNDCLELLKQMGQMHHEDRPII